MGAASTHHTLQQKPSDSVSDRVRLSDKKEEQSSPSSSSNNGERTENSGVSVASQTQTGDRPIVAVAHRYQRSWKSRLAASMRQARDFLSRPRIVGRTYSTRRHNVAPTREELLKNDVKLDINVATKQELQRLPAIDSSLASAIVEHRKLLVGGRFKRIDDLVNVPGLDVEKLNRLREFIQLSKVKPSASGDSIESKPNKALVSRQLSNNNSPTGSDGQNAIANHTASGITVTLSPSYSGPRLSCDNETNHAPIATTALLNINKATEQDFVNIAGIPEEVAKKLVMARQNSGPFHSVSDIKRVKGVSKSFFVKVRDKLTVDDTLSQHKVKLIGPGLTMTASASTGNFRPTMETDSGVATTISIIAGGSSSDSNAGGPPSNSGLASGSVASASTSKQVSPDSTVREMDINNLPDVIIKYTKPSDLELIHKLQMNSQNAGRGGRGRGLQTRGHSRNISDYGVIADYTEVCSPIYPSDMHGIRPIVEPFDFRAATNEPIVRFAFWDLEDCGMDKISNPGVLETICMTLLENGVSIAAFTDLLDTGVVDRIADQLTWPSLHCVREWRGGRGSWRAAIVKTGYRGSNNCETEPRSRTSSGGSNSGDGDGDRQPIYCGFVYDTSRSIEMVSRYNYSSPLQQPTRRLQDDTHDVVSSKSPHPECLNVALPKTTLHRLSYRPAAAKFSLSASPSSDEEGNAGEPSHLAVVCLKLSQEDSAFFRRRDIALSTAPLLTAVLEAVSSFGDVPQTGNKQTTSIPIILAGSFGVDAGERCFDLLRVADYQLVSNEKTNINRKQPSGTICGDQVWVTDVGASSSPFRQYTGRAGVVRKALTHPQIPDGWAWGGLVSSHCPVWAEFYTTPQPYEKTNLEQEPTT